MESHSHSSSLQSLRPSTERDTPTCGGNCGMYHVILVAMASSRAGQGLWRSVAKACTMLARAGRGTSCREPGAGCLTVCRCASSPAAAVCGVEVLKAEQGGACSVQSQTDRRWTYSLIECPSLADLDLQQQLLANPVHVVGTRVEVQQGPAPAHIGQVDGRKVQHALPHIGGAGLRTGRHHPFSSPWCLKITDAGVRVLVWQLTNQWPFFVVCEGKRPHQTTSQ